MNRKGQVGLGAIIIGFVALIVALAIYTGGITGPIGTMTQTQTNVNKTFAAPSAVGGSIFLDGQINTTLVIAVNATNGSQVLPATNYTVTQDVSTGVIKLKFTLLTGVPSFAGKNINVSYGYQPEGYIDDAGARSVTNMIPLMAVLAIIAIGIWTAYNNGYLDDLLDSFK